MSFFYTIPYIQISIHTFTDILIIKKYKARKTSMILEKQLLLRINLARVIRSFPNSRRLIILLFTSGKLPRPTPNLVEVPVNSPQGQIV